MTRINKKSTRTNNKNIFILIYYSCKENKTLKKGEKKIMSDPLFEVCLDYVNQIEDLTFSFNVMTGLMVLWMIIAIVEFSALKVYMKGE